MNGDHTIDELTYLLFEIAEYKVPIDFIRSLVILMSNPKLMQTPAGRIKLMDILKNEEEEED